MKSRLPFVFIILTVIIDAIGVGIIMPVTPDLVKELTGNDISGAALWGGALMFSFAVMQFLFMPIVGNLSDKFGRRPVLLISLFAMAIDYLLHGLAGSIWLLFVARLIAGVLGATYSTAMAYLADISAPEDRAANFGLVGAAFGIGFILGPAMGGMLGEFGTRAPFYAAALLALGNAILGYFVVQESLPAEKRRAFDWSRANPFGALMRIRTLPAISGLMLILFIFDIANFVYPAIWSYFTIEKFEWTPAWVGYSLAAYGIGVAIMQGGVIRPMISRWGERRTAEIGFVAAFLAAIVLALINQGWQVFAFMPLIAISGVAGPAISGMMANRVKDDEQGELQGVMGSLASIGMLISLMIMPITFRTFTKSDAIIYMPGAPFIVAAILTLVALFLLVRTPRSETKSS